MLVDYGNSITGIKDYKGRLTGVNIGGTFLPVDLIKQLYEKIYDVYGLEIEKGKCKPIPDKNVYEYYQWDGNPDAIKNITFLKDIHDNFKINGSGFGKYHLCYIDGKSGEYLSIYPGNYIVNVYDERHCTEISVYNEEEFKEKYIYK